MRFADLFGLFRKRAHVHQSNTDLSGRPSASQTYTSPGTNGITHGIETKTLNWDYGILYDRYDRQVQGLLGAAQIGYHDGFGYQPASHAHPLPVSGSQILYRNQLVRTVPNWHPGQTVISVPLLALIGAGGPLSIVNQTNPSTRAQLLRYLVEKAEDGHAASIFAAMGTVNPFAKVFPRFPVELTAFSFQAVHDNTTQHTVRFYQTQNPAVDANPSNVVMVDVPAPRRYGEWSTNTIDRDFHRVMKMLYSQSTSGIPITNYEEPMAHDRVYRQLNRASMIYTGGRFKHYRLIVIPAGYSASRVMHGVYALLYPGMGAAFRSEANASEVYHPAYGSTDPIPLGFEHSPIGVGWDVRIEADRPLLRKNPKLFVIDFTDQDYRGIEYLSVHLGMIGFDPGLGAINCETDPPNFQPTPVQQQNSQYTPLGGDFGPAGVMNSPTELVVEPETDRTDLPDSCISPFNTESEGLMLLLGRPWSNLDFELVTRRPDHSGSPTQFHLSRMSILSSAYVYLVGLDG